MNMHMTRAEIRRIQKEKEKGSRSRSYSNDEIRQIKDAQYEKGVAIGLEAGLGVSVMILRDKYSEIMKRISDGKCREERFAEMYIDLLDSFQKGYVTLDDLEETIFEETGMRIEL